MTTRLCSCMFRESSISWNGHDLRSENESIDGINNEGVKELGGPMRIVWHLRVELVNNLGIKYATYLRNPVRVFQSTIHSVVAVQASESTLTENRGTMAMYFVRCQTFLKKSTKTRTTAPLSFASSHSWYLLTNNTGWGREVVGQLINAHSLTINTARKHCQTEQLGVQSGKDNARIPKAEILNQRAVITRGHGHQLTNLHHNEDRLLIVRFVWPQDMDLYVQILSLTPPAKDFVLLKIQL